MKEKQAPSCTHPVDRRFAWVVYDDPLSGRDVLCMGCCVCGAVRCGAVGKDGEPVGPQWCLGPKPKKSKKKVK